MDAKDHQSKNSKNAVNKHPYNKNEKPNQSKKSISKSPQKSTPLCKNHPLSFGAISLPPPPPTHPTFISHKAV